MNEDPLDDPHDDPLGRIDYAESGDQRTGPTVVLLPGSCATGAAWRPVVEAWDGRFRCVTTSLLGFKERYEMNEWSLMGRGDILLLHTDGLADHRRKDHYYFPDALEQRLREVKHLGAKEIYEAIRKDVLAFAEQTDDISMVVIKLV